MMPFIECDTSLAFLSTYQDSSSKLHDYLFLICVKNFFPSEHVLFPLLLINPIICILSPFLPFSLFPLKVFLSASLLKSFHFFIISATFLNRVNSNWISKNTLAVFTRVLSWFSSFAIIWDCPLIRGDSLFFLPLPNQIMPLFLVATLWVVSLHGQAAIATCYSPEKCIFWFLHFVIFLLLLPAMCSSHLRCFLLRFSCFLHFDAFLLSF